MSKTEQAELDELNTEVLTDVLSAFQRLSLEGRQRLLHTIATFFGMESRPSSLANEVPRTTFAPPVHSDSSFSTDRSLSPKEFIFQKAPRNDIERIVCLAYFLTHYRDTPYFKTVDLSKLNTEAAQPKFSNAAWAVNNATIRRYLVAATKGNKQLSAAGEQYVHALPDRDAAKAAMERTLPKRKPKKPIQKRGTDN
jgi:hypothetical protein